jgi:hypothetical protein
MIALTKRERAESRVCMGYICRGLRRILYMFDDGADVCKVCAECEKFPELPEPEKICNTCAKSGMDYYMHTTCNQYLKCKQCCKAYQNKRMQAKRLSHMAKRG